MEIEPGLAERVITSHVPDSLTSASRLGGHRATLLSSICILVATVSGCGFNNPGEPRSLARQLGAPSAGDANVYCVPDRTPELCDVQLDAAASSSTSAVVAWWLRAAKEARRTGVFTYKGSRWQWRAVTLTRPLDGHQQTVGWKCRNDAGLRPAEVSNRMWAREPWRENQMHTLAMAGARGCRLDTYPPPPKSNAGG